MELFNRNAEKRVSDFWFAGGEVMSTVNLDLAKSGSVKTEAADSNRFVRKNYFPTMIFRYDVEGSEHLNKVLLDLTYAEREQGLAVNKSNTAELGRGRSATNLHKNPDYAPLLMEIDAALSRISEELSYAKDHVLKVTSMWSVINPPGTSDRAQVHPGSLWSGFYHIQAPVGSGTLKFIDPRAITTMNRVKYASKKKQPRDCWIKADFKPVPGQMIIFPAWLYHESDTNVSKEKGRAGDRAFVAFNINQVKK